MQSTIDLAAVILAMGRQLHDIADALPSGTLRLDLRCHADELEQLSTDIAEGDYHA